MASSPRATADPLPDAPPDAVPDGDPAEHTIERPGANQARHPEVEIVEDLFTVEPWCVREPRLRLDELGTSEAVLALANGHLGVRGTLDEGDPASRPGTYLAGFHELRSMVYTETAMGDPDTTDTLVSVIDGSQVRLIVDDQPLDVREGEVHAHERVLDLRTGLLTRDLVWSSAAGRRVAVRSQRLVSFVHRAVSAVRYTVTALDEPVELAVVSGLVANPERPQLPAHPTAEDLLAHPLDGVEHRAADTRLALLHRAHRSRLLVAAAAEHRVTGLTEQAQHAESTPDRARFTVTGRLTAGQEVVLVKVLGYGWSAVRSDAAVRDEADAALTTGVHAGWDGLVAAQREFLDAFWADADVEIDGDPQLQQAARFALWHLLQATARAEGHGIAGKALTGTGYEGHAFWDSETFVLQAMTALRPEVARHALGWRHSGLAAAHERARQLDLRGAAFPWRTIGGRECSGYWPAGTAAFHVNADIADAVVRYVEVTGDDAFARGPGLDLLVGTARLWASLGHHGRDGRFHLYGVTGPDEYSALSDDNVYTNLMARRNLLRAAGWAAAWPDGATRLDVDAAEWQGWQAAGNAMAVPYDDELGVHPQAAGFTDQPTWDFEGTDETHYPLHSHYPYLQLYRKQVVKQADLVLAMLLCGEEFTPEQKARNVAYYEAITVRDSSLSACVQSVLAAEVGHLDLALGYLAESALADLRDREHDSSDGLHVAALAGTWIALVAGFGGLRQVEGHLRFRPALPAGLDRLVFRLRHRGTRLQVTVLADEVTYAGTDGPELTVIHEDEPVTVPAGGTVRRPLSPRRPAGDPPVQPQTRAPGRRAAPPR